MKATSRVNRPLVLLWTMCFLGMHLPSCGSHPQYHSEEELEEHMPPKIFPSHEFIVKGNDASEAADMLNTTNIQLGDTELVDSPDVVNLGGKTHEEKGNTTTFYNSTFRTPVEEACKIPIDLIKGFQETIQNYTFPKDWLRDSRNIPLINCTVVVVNNDEKLQCPIPVKKATDDNSTSTFITNLPNETTESFNKLNISLCPHLEKRIASTANPTFICTDRIEGTLRTTVCHIPKQWLKNKSTITKLNCTDTENTTTGTEICTITKEIVQKNITNILNCESLLNSTTACLVPQEWMKYKVFSVLNCDKEQNSTSRNCTFPQGLIASNTTGNDCTKGEDNTTACTVHNGIKCTHTTNSTKMQCQIPKDWLRENSDATKLNCTDDNANTTQKVCTVPTEWLRENTTIKMEAINQTNINENVCYIPKQMLLENTSNSQLNCSSDNLTTVCHVPNEGENITAMCLVFNDIRNEEKTLRCTTNSEGNFTTFVCSEPGSDIPNNVTENWHTTELGNTEGVTSTTQNETENVTSAQYEVQTKGENSFRSETPTEEAEISCNDTTKQTNAHNSSAVPVPQFSDVTTQTTSTEVDNSTSVKINTQKETEHVSSADGIDIPQTVNESKAAIKLEDKALQEIDIVHYEPAAPPAAFSQLHSEHNHATVNEQTVTFLRPTESAAILVGVFIVFAVIGYAGLLIWRRMLEKRYGNRQLLINEDDDFNTANNFEMPMYELQERFWPRGVDRGSSSCDIPQKSVTRK